jgi:hypothetical protein
MLFTNTSNSSSPSLNLYLKSKPNSTDIITAVDESADEFADVAFRISIGGRDFIFRGIVQPQGDQITVSLEDLHLSIAITDQFSTNVTLVSLARKSSFATLTRIGQIANCASLHCDRHRALQIGGHQRTRDSGGECGN